jgi:hypothetical protein
MLELKQGEAKTLKFTVKNRSTGQIVPVNGATCTFGLRLQEGVANVVDIADGDFDKSEGLSGILRITLSSTDTNQTPGTYIGELKIVIDADNVDKSSDIMIKIKRALT